VCVSLTALLHQQTRQQLNSQSVTNPGHTGQQYSSPPPRDTHTHYTHCTHYTPVALTTTTAAAAALTVPLAALQGHRNWVLVVAWSPDAAVVATGDMDGQIWLWDAASGDALGRCVGHTKWITSLVRNSVLCHVILCGG
jgi:WD40 repeat protein